MTASIGIVLKWIGIGTAIIFALLSAVAVLNKPKSVFKDEPEQEILWRGNLLFSFLTMRMKTADADGVKGHLEVVGYSKHCKSIYEKYINIKRTLDVVASFFGLIILSPVMACVAIAIKVEDPWRHCLLKNGLEKTNNTLSYISSAV